VDSLRPASRSGTGSILKIIAFFLSVFLLILILYNQSTFQLAHEKFLQEQRAALSAEMELFKRELADRAKEYFEKPELLSQWSAKRRMRILLFSKSGKLLRDSSGRPNPDSLSDLTDIHSHGMDLLWKGVPLFKGSADPNEAGTSYSESLTLPGWPEPFGIRLLKTEVVREDQESRLYLFLIKALGVLLLALLAISLYRYLKGMINRETFFEGGEIQDSNPLFHTFQGLIQELKNKELELEKLKRSAEIRAVRSENYQASILRTVSSGVITFNKARIVTSLNESAEKIFDISKKEFMGRSCAALFGEESKLLGMLNKTIDENEPIARAEMEVFKGKNRERIWIGVSSSILSDEGGAFLGATLIFTDITEIKALQEQVELQKRLSVLGEMSAGIAHEFRNYMGTIFGYVRLLGKKVEKDPSDRQMTETIISELKAMDYLIQQLLNFGKNNPPNRKSIQLEPFFKQVVAQLTSVYSGKLPDVRILIPDTISEIQADEVLMRQALINLIQNGFEAMPDGGVMTISAREKSSDKRKSVIIEIRDTGSGITKENLEKIFVPFFTQKEKGTGLGLAIVHKIVTSHGGRIRVESELGKGCLFQIELPQVFAEVLA